MTGKSQGKSPIDVAFNNPSPRQFATEADYFSDCILQNKEPKTGGEEGLRDQSGAHQQGRRSRRRQGFPSDLQHLRRHRPEAVEHRARHRRFGRSRRDALHDCRRGLGLRFRVQPISRAVRRRGDWRMVHGQRHGRAHHLRRFVQARRRVSPGVAHFEASVRPRSVSRRRVLSAQPSARTQRARRRKIRQRLAHRAAHHRDAGRRRFGLHSDERDFHHRRPDLSGNGFVLSRRASGDFRRSCPFRASVPPRRSRR